MEEREFSSIERRRLKREKAAIKKKRRKKSFIILLLILAAIIIFVICSSHVPKDEKEFKKFAQQQFVEEMILVTCPDKVDENYYFDEDENGFSIAVQHDAKAGKQITAFAGEKIKEIEGDFKKKASNDAESALLVRWTTSQGQVGSTSLAVYSVLYEDEDGKLVQKMERVNTYQFKTSNMNLIKPKQFLNEGYKEIVSEQAADAVKKEYGRKELKEGWEEYFTPIDKHFNRFVLSSDELIFYEKAGIDGRYVKATVPLKKIDGAVKSKVAARMIQPGDKIVALTYDDGPGGKSEEKILESIEKYDAVATFFYLGNIVKKDSKNVKKAYELGCEIGNHSWDHSDMTKLKSKKIKEQIKKTDEAIEKVTGKKPTVFRPPYGSYDDKVLKAVKHPVALWSVDSKDWESKNKDKILDVVENADNLDGSIVLLHSIHDSTADATEELLTWLNWHGYQTVTVTELAKYQGNEPKAHKVIHCE